MPDALLLGRDTCAVPEYILSSPGNNRPRWSEGERLEDLFAALAETAPDAVAVECDLGKITFSDLEARANRLAWWLAETGYGGERIGLVLRPSLEAYVAILAVLKAGGAYVPMDPSFPPDRVSYIAEDAGLAAILTDHGASGGLQDAAIPVHCLDVIRAEVDRQPTMVPGRMLTNDLAYVIYTSGSTGRPKGVPIDHAMIVNFVRVAAETYGYRTGDRVYQGLTLAFDFSVEEIWVPLLAGATLVPNETGANLLGDDLCHFLRDRKITAMCCVPTLLATLDAELPHLRLLIVSGEACPDEIVRRWHRDGVTILNAYGPTETTVTATVARLVPGRSVTIGTPLPTYAIVILDPVTQNVLPLGETGEIGIAGIGLSRGYLGRDDLTAAAFIPDPLPIDHNPSGRIYRSGDLGRIDTDGNVVCLGRIDTQVKIRGYRIELTEIESVIMEVRGVAQAVVAAFAPNGSSKELVAYYSENARGISPEDLHAQLRVRLPAYMVPAYFERLEAIPLLPAGKADRKALPEPSGRRICLHAGDYQAPETAEEECLAEVLGAELDFEEVSVTDEFFDELGLNSLIVASLATKLRPLFGTISISDFYRHRTIRSLAAHLAEAQPTTPLLNDTEQHRPSDLAIWLTGTYQVLAAMAYAAFLATIMLRGASFALTAETALGLWGRAVLASSLAMALAILLPVAAKWLLLGRMEVTRFPIYGVMYAKFWTARSLARLSPLALVPGTPLYTAHLKMLGADVAWTALVQSPVPGCPDLLSVGAHAVIGREVHSACYRARAGWIETGRVTVDREALVGERSVLEIETCVGSGAVLSHASALLEGACIPEGEHWLGSPARPSTFPPRRPAFLRISALRRIVHASLSLIVAVALFGPIGMWLVAAPYLGTGVLPIEGPPPGMATAGTLQTLPEIILGTTGVYLGALLLALCMAVTLPRLIRPLLRVDVPYRLYGLRHFLFEAARRGSNVQYLNHLFGDSSYILGYLRAIGYRFDGIFNTGSNFGTTQKHDLPWLCRFGRGTMVSDGLSMANAEFSSGGVTLSEARVGAESFLGNLVLYPAGSHVGDDVLIGTKSHIPTAGAVMEHTGLVGSPAIGIPRTVARDRRFDHYKEPKVLSDRLRLKNRHNLATMALFLLAKWSALLIVVLISYVIVVDFGLWGALATAASVPLLMTVKLACDILAERAAIPGGKLSPQYCSIYDEYFWRHERMWKMYGAHLFRILNGTPMKPLAWRLLGARVGRGVFDDGLTSPEATLLTIGDHVTLNERSVLQPHSLEDGTFKSDHITIGDGATIGSYAFVHYGCTLGEGAEIRADSFVMKGTCVSPHHVWSGNPAQECRVPLGRDCFEAGRVGAHGSLARAS